MNRQGLLDSLIKADKLCQAAEEVLADWKNSDNIRNTEADGYKELKKLKSTIKDYLIARNKYRPDIF